MGLQKNGRYTGNERYPHWRSERQLLSAREFLKVVEVCELTKTSSSSTLGFREQLLPVSVAVMSFSRLELVRFSVISLSVSAAVMLFSRLVLVRYPVFFCLSAPP